MFERFSENARRAMAHANQETQQLGEAYIGTEHLLIGLTRGNGMAAKVLMQHGVDATKVRAAVVAMKNVETVNAIGQNPMTTGAKKLIESAVEEARRLGHAYIGTEHLLLAMISDENKDSLATRVLVQLLGESFTNLRADILQTLVKEAGDESGKLLLELLRDEMNVATRALRKLGVNVEDVRAAIFELEKGK